MRRVLLIGVSVVVVLGAAAEAYHVLHHGNLLQDAQHRFNHGDVYGAGLDLDSYLRAHPGDPAANFQLGVVYLAQENPVAAERVLRRAWDAHYDPKLVVLPLGEAYLRQRKYDEVLNDFVVERAPKDCAAEILAVRASAYLGLKRLTEAKDAAAAGMQAAPGMPDSILVAARVAMASGDIAGAEGFVDRVLAKDPKRVDALLVKSELAMHRNDVPTALKLAQSVLDAQPNRLDAKMAVARALAAEHHDLEASKLVDEVLKQTPRDVGANYLRVVVGVRQRDFAAADAALQVISPVIDELPQGDYFLAVTKLGRNQPAQAQEAAAKFVARYPDDAAGEKLLAFAELALHRPDKADAALKPLVAKGNPDADTLDLIARADAMRGNIKGAEENLAQAAALQPENTEILNRLAASKLGLGNVEAGENDLRRSLQEAPDQPLPAMTLVQTELAEGNVPEATATIARLRKAVGDTELVGVLDAQAKVAAMDLDGAKALYLDVLKRFPESRDAVFGLVQVEGRLGEAKTAEERLTGWMAVHPTDKQGLRLQVKSQMAAGDRKAALAAAEAAHAGNPSDPEITALLAELYMTSKRAEDAVALLDRAEGAQSGPLMVLRGQALVEAGKPDDAVAIMKAALLATPRDLRARFSLIQLDIKTQDYDGARQLINEGLGLDPGNPQLLEGAVAVDLKQNGIQAALKTARALQDDPRNMPGALLLPGGALAANGDMPGAAAAYLAAYKQAPSADLALAAASALLRSKQNAAARSLMEDWTAQHPDDVKSLEILSSLAITEHRNDDAAKLLEHILKLRPNNAAALNNLAWLKLGSGDLPAAQGLALRAFYLAPGPETQDTLGWVMARLGHAPQSLVLLEQAAQAKPTQGILYHYAYALDANGHRADARAAVDKALAQTTPFDERSDAVALQARVAP